MTLMEDKRLARGGRRRGHSLGPGHPAQDTGVHQDGSQGGEERHLGPQPKPDNETLLMTSLSSVSVHLVRFRPPGHRVMIGGMGPMWGHLVTWRLWPRTRHQTV